MKILQKILKLDFILQIINWIAVDRPLPKGKNKSNLLNQICIRLKNHEKVCWIKSKNL